MACGPLSATTTKAFAPGQKASPPGWPTPAFTVFMMRTSLSDCGAGWAPVRPGTKSPRGTAHRMAMAQRRVRRRQGSIVLGLTRVHAAEGAFIAGAKACVIDPKSNSRSRARRRASVLPRFT